MKKSIVCCLLGLLLLGCEKTEYAYRYGAPIQFYSTTQSAYSRGGQTLNSLNGCSYGVIGYLYDMGMAWETVHSQAKPDANWQNIVVQCDNDGNSIYQPLQHWNYGNRYAFFAYYPHSNSSTGVQMIEGYANKEDVPQIVYTIPNAAFTGSANLMQDVMVATKVDCSMQNTSNVELYFQHVLFAIKVVLQNYNNEAVGVRNLVLQLDNVKYQKATIPLDGSAITPTGTTKTLTHTYVGNTPISVPSTNNSAPYSLTNDENHIMLIPQVGLTGSITLDVLKSNGIYEKETVSLDFSENTFEAGHLYVISVQFLSDQVVVNTLSQSTWDDDSSQIEFE